MKNRLSEDDRSKVRCRYIDGEDLESLRVEFGQTRGQMKRILGFGWVAKYRNIFAQHRMLQSAHAELSAMHKTALHRIEMLESRVVI